MVRGFGADDELTPTLGDPSQVYSPETQSGRKAGVTEPATGRV